VLDGGGWLRYAPAPLSQGITPVPIIQEAEWAPGLAGAKNFAPPGFNHRIIQPIASRYAIPAHQLENVTSGLEDKIIIVSTYNGQFTKLLNVADYWHTGLEDSLRGQFYIGTVGGQISILRYVKNLFKILSLKVAF
jgi:hypothetical protein